VLRRASVSPSFSILRLASTIARRRRHRRSFRAAACWFSPWDGWSLILRLFAELAFVAAFRCAVSRRELGETAAPARVMVRPIAKTERGTDGLGCFLLRWRRSSEKSSVTLRATVCLSSAIDAAPASAVLSSQFAGKHPAFSGRVGSAEMFFRA